MPINLTISAETVEEFDTLLERFSRPTASTSGSNSLDDTLRQSTGANAAMATSTTRRRTKPQPTPGGTDAPPAESIPPNQGVDPFAQPDAAATGSQAAGSSASGEQASATPAASSPADAAAAASGEVTVQALKDAMAALLKAKSAGVAMQVLEGATGCKSLTSGSPSVVEKAKDDPNIMRVALDALLAAAAA